MATTAGKRIFRRKRCSLNKTVDNFNQQEAAKTAAGFLGRPEMMLQMALPVKG